jgi:hypothetical protein
VRRLCAVIAVFVALVFLSSGSHSTVIGPTQTIGFGAISTQGFTVKATVATDKFKLIGYSGVTVTGSGKTARIKYRLALEHYTSGFEAGTPRRLTYSGQGYSGIKPGPHDTIWSSWYGFEQSSTITNHGGFGAYGTTKDTLAKFWIGPDYLTPYLSITPTASAFSTTLSATALTALGGGVTTTQSGVSGVFGVDGTGVYVGSQAGANLSFYANSVEQGRFGSAGGFQLFYALTAPSINMPLGSSLTSYNAYHGIGTPNSSGTQIFTGVGDSVRIGSLTAGPTFVDWLQVTRVAGSPNKVVCWKTATELGYCSTVIDSTGACTCN